MSRVDDGTSKQILRPNTTQTPDLILDNLPSFTDVELRVVLVVIRATLGWRKVEDWLTCSQIAERAGRSRVAVSKAIKALVEHEIIIIKTEDEVLLDTPEGRKEAGRQHKKFYYQLNTRGPVNLVNKACIKSLQGLVKKVNTTTPTQYNTQTLQQKEKTGSAQPTGRQAVKFPKEDYEFVLDAYQKIKGITLRGPEFSPRQQDIKSMFLAGHKREAIVACMWALEKSKEEWTVNWTLGTVRMKLPEFVAGKLFGGDGRDKDRIRALKEDIAEIDHYLEYQIEGRLAKLEWKDGDLTLEEQEEKERLERMWAEKQEERARLMQNLRKGR